MSTRTMIIGPYLAKSSRDRYMTTLRNRNPGAVILARRQGPGYYIEHYNCYQVFNSGRGIMPLEQWIQWHKAQRKNDLAGLSSPAMIRRYWETYVKNHGGRQPNDVCRLNMVSSWPPINYGALPPVEKRFSPNYSNRTSRILGIVIHETEGSYTSAVNWLTNPKSRVSAHRVLSEQGERCALLVTDNMRAWHAGNCNDWTLGLELAGSVKTANHTRQIANAARITAYWCQRYGIPARVADKYGKGGIATHRQLIGNDHTDPDLNGPLAGDGMAAFIEKVRAELALAGFPGVW